MSGSRLRAIRQQLNMSQAEFGRATGYGSKSIANYESNRRKIPLPLAISARNLLSLYHIKKDLEKATLPP